MTREGARYATNTVGIVVDFLSQTVLLAAAIAAFWLYRPRYLWIPEWPDKELSACKTAQWRHDVRWAGVGEIAEESQSQDR